MPIHLTPELAAKMLDVWQRRQKDDPATVYELTLLEAALAQSPLVPGFVRVEHDRMMTESIARKRKADTEWLTK